MTTRDARFSHLLFSNIFQLFTSRTLLCSFSKSSLQYLLVLIVFISTYRLSTSGSNICSAVGVFFSMISLYLHPKILLFFFSTPYFFFNVYIFDNSTSPHSSLRFKATSRGFSPKASSTTDTDSEISIINAAGGFSYNPNPVPLCLYVFLHPLRALSVYMASGIHFHFILLKK